MRLNTFMHSLLFVIGVAAARGPRHVPLSACNGDVRLCDRSYSNITQIGTHNSAFARWGNLASNQERGISTQLDAGIRFLQAQTHLQLGTLRMCHTRCIILDTGTLTSYLDKIRKWITKLENQQQVVTILLTNPNGADIGRYDKLFKNLGLDTMAYVPVDNLRREDWPTLQELIASGKRLIVFMDRYMDTERVPYILPEYKFYFETKYANFDAAFPDCGVDRPRGSSPEGKMTIMNHYLYRLLFKTIQNSDKKRAPIANAPENIIDHANRCAAIYGGYPQVVLVDWFLEGNVFEAQKRLNGLD